MDTQELRESVRRINAIANEEWLAGLGPRKMAELEFHNLDRDESRVEAARADPDTYEHLYGNKKYYTAARRSAAYVDDWVEANARDKVFLDYACGYGKYAVMAAKAGARLSLGLDISDVSVRNAQARAEEQGAPETMFFQADAEDTRLPANSVDTVICAGMLHHLDLSYAFPELRRIMKPGGKLLAIEALGYNPLIKLYRKLTPQMRTEYEAEHILSIRDLRFGRRFFDVGEVRYWHVVSYIAGKYPKLLEPLEAVDSVLTRIPGIRLMAWMFTFELVNQSE